MPISTNVREGLEKLATFFNPSSDSRKNTFLNHSKMRIFIDINALLLKDQNEIDDKLVRNFFINNPELLANLKSEFDSLLPTLMQTLVPPEEKTSSSIIQQGLAASQSAETKRQAVVLSSALSLDSTEEEFQQLESKEQKYNPPAETERKTDLPDVLSTITDKEIALAAAREDKRHTVHQRFMEAVKKRDFPMMVWLCRNGLDLNADFPPWDKTSPMSDALAADQNTKTISLLFQLGYQLKPLDIINFIARPLNHHLFSVAELKKRWNSESGIIKSNTWYHGEAILSDRCSKAFEGNSSVFDYIANTDLQWTDPLYDMNVLYFAVFGGNLAIVKKICACCKYYKISAEQENRNQTNPLLTAIECNHLHIVKYLVEEQHFSLKRRFYKDVTALHKARSFAMVEYLVSAAMTMDPKSNQLRAPEIIRAQSESGFSALMEICQNYAFSPKGEFQKSMKLLIETDRRLFANNPGYISLVNLRTKAGNTFAHLLVHSLPELTFSERKEILFTLAASGADINIANNQEDTPLHSICSSTSLSEPEKQELINFFLDQGADVNQRNSEGYTPLMRMQTRNPALFELLIQRGAQINVQNNDGNTAVQMAFDPDYNSLKKSMDIYIKHGGDVHAATGRPRPMTSLEFAIFTGTAKSIEVTTKVSLLLTEYNVTVSEFAMELAVKRLKVNSGIYDSATFVLLLWGFLKTGKKLSADLEKEIQRIVKRSLIQPPFRELAEGLLADANANHHKAKQKYAYVLDHPDERNLALTVLSIIHHDKAKKLGFGLLEQKAEAKVEKTASGKLNLPEMFELLQTCIRCDHDRPDLLLNMAETIEHQLTTNQASANEQAQLAVLYKAMGLPPDEKTSALGEWLGDQASEGVGQDYVNALLESPKGKSFVELVPLKKQLADAKKQLDAISEQEKSVSQQLADLKVNTVDPFEYHTKEMIAEKLKTQEVKTAKLSERLTILRKEIFERKTEITVLQDLMEQPVKKHEQLLRELHQKQKDETMEKLTFLRPLQYQVLNSILPNKELVDKLTGKQNYQCAQLIFHLQYDQTGSMPLTPEDYAKKMAKDAMQEVKENNLPGYLATAYKFATAAVEAFKKEGLDDQSDEVRQAMGFKYDLKKLGAVETAPSISLFNPEATAQSSAPIADASDEKRPTSGLGKS